MGKGTKIESPQPVDPFAVAQADFLFNRFNQQTPTSNLIFTKPNQAPPPGQTVSFVDEFLTPQAKALLAPQLPEDGSTAGTGGTAPSSSSTSPQPTAGGAVPPTFGGKGQAGQFGNMGRRGSPATATQLLAPGVLALENARLTSSANVLADALSRQAAISEQGLPPLITSLDRTSLQDRPTIGDPERFRDEVINAMIQRGTQNLERDFGREFDIVQQALEDRGLPLGTEAANRTIEAFGKAQSDALERLTLDAILAGGQEASRAFGDTLNRAAAIERTRAGNIGEQLTEANLAQSQRGQVLNELNVLLGLPQVNAPPIQSFLPTSPTGVVDAFGLNVAGQNARAQVQSQLAASQKGGLSNLIGDLGAAFILRGR